MVRRLQKNVRDERKRELEKSASTTRSIVDMFPTRLDKGQSQDKGPLPAPPPAAFSPKISGGKDKLEPFRP